MSATDMPSPSGVGSGSFRGARSRRIYWCCWPVAASQSGRGLVVVVHGLGEHLGRYEQLAAALTSAGYYVWALDHHGHGHSDGPRGQLRFDDAVSDLDQLVAMAREQHPELPLFLFGHSLGGGIALRYAMVHQDELDGLILSSPLAVLDAGRGAALLVQVLGRLVPGLPTTKLDATAISRDPAVVERYKSDPLVSRRAVPAGTAREMLRHVRTLPRDADRITLPTLLLYGTADRLCPPRGAEMLAERLGSEDLTVYPYAGLYHEILNEPERELVLADMLAWLTAHASAVRGGKQQPA
jgi:acylglycerol lipase